MEFIDLKAIHNLAKNEIETAISRVIEHGRFINGPEVKELEQTLSEFSETNYCTAVSSGTMALEIALRALNIGPGDEVITTPFTWISTAETIALVRAKPVFVDINSDSYNICPEAISRAITSKTKAIIPVNLFGQLADYKRILEIANERKIAVIEDAAQSFGAQQNKQQSCSFGTISCTSFFPAKPLGCYGDGGAVFTKDAELAEKIKAITNHGGLKRGEHTLVGTNGRCDTLQASILLAKLPAFKKEIELRQQIGARYSKLLKNTCCTPVIMNGNSHIYAQYTIRHTNRDALSAALKEKSIPTAIYYKDCLHLQKVFQPLGYKKGDFPVAELAASEVLSLPMHPHLSVNDQDQIATAVNAFK